MLATSLALCALLWFGVATIWVGGRWAVSLLEAGVFVLSATVLLRGASKKPCRPQWPVWLLVAIAGWGLLQLVMGWTISPGETEYAVLYWLAAACFFGLGMTIADRRQFLNVALWSGAVMSALALAQLHTSHGRLLWLFPTNEDVIYGTFPYYNNYAAFVELLLPLALWRALEGRRWWLYAGVSALMYGSVIASTSRAGALLVSLELVVMLGLTASKTSEGNFKFRVLAVLAGVAVFALVAGYQAVWQRLWLPDPYSVRREYLQTALAMIHAHPLRGSGLGTWTSAYPAYAVADFGVVANHAHSEWAQWAAEGGLGIPALMAALFFMTLRRGLQTVWGIGLAAVLLHALVDYPLVRLGLGSWWFAMAGLLVATEHGDRPFVHFRSEDRT